MQAIKTLCLFIAAGLALQSTASDTLIVSIPTTVSDNLPNITERIIQSLSNTDLEIDINHLPNKRSLLLLRQGKVALEFFRTPSVMSQYKNLIKLDPPIQSLKFKMVTSANSPELCKKNEAEYHDLSMAGVLGIDIHNTHFFPKFKQHATIGNVISTVKFIAMQRADVSFLPDQMLVTVPENITDKLVVCDQNFKDFPFHGHLHKDFLFAKEQLEAAIHSEFGS